MSQFLFLFFSMLLLCSSFRLKESFKVKNSLTTSLFFFFFLENAKWIKRGSPYSRNKFCLIYSHLVICFCGWQRNYTWSMTKAKINIWSVNFTEGKRDSQIHEPAWGVTYLLKYTRPVKFFFQFVKALIFSRNLYSRTEIWISPPFLLPPLLCLFKNFLQWIFQLIKINRFFALTSRGFQFFLKVWAW